MIILILITLLVVSAIIILLPGLVGNPKVCDSKHLKSRIVFQGPNYNSLFGGYASYNPSIDKTSSGYIMAYRYSQQGRYNNLQMIRGFINKGSDIIISILDMNFRPLKQTRVSIPNQKSLEDPRIICYKDYYIIVCCWYNDAKIIPIIILIDKELNLIKWYYAKCKDFELSSKEKNWVPFVIGEDVYIHCDCHPKWIIRKLDIDSGILTTPVIWDSRGFFGGLSKKYFIRCSTSWVELNDKLYCGIHIKYGLFAPLLYDYKSIFIEIDRNTFLPHSISNSFCLDDNHRNIQFLSGMCISHDNKLLLGVGYGDYTFIIIQYDKPINELF